MNDVNEIFYNIMYMLSNINEEHRVLYFHWTKTKNQCSKTDRDQNWMSERVNKGLELFQVQTVCETSQNECEYLGCLRCVSFG